MTLMLFNLAGIAMVGWAMMIFLPRWRFTRLLVEWTLFPVILCALYLVGVLTVLVETGPGIAADFGNAEGVIGLLAQPDIALVAWIHILAFDHLVGVGIFRDNLAHDVLSSPLQSLVLFVTLMFGPAGFLAYWIVRTVRMRDREASGPTSSERAP